MAELTREQILARKLGGGESFELPDGSGSVVLRGLTRQEALEVRDADTLADKDNVLISHGMVSPQLTVDDVATWAAQDSAGVLSLISNRISELSNMQEGAGKSRVPRSRRRS